MRVINDETSPGRFRFMQKFNNKVNSRSGTEFKVEVGIKDKMEADTVKTSLKLENSKQNSHQNLSVNFITLSKLGISAEVKPHKHVLCTNDCLLSTRFIPSDQCNTLTFKMKDNFESITNADEHQFI